MYNLKNNNINLLVDFDSTFVTVETIDEIAKLSCDDKTIAKIKQITKSAMAGKLSFSEALSKRVKLINANKIHISKIINLLKTKISSSILLNKEFIINNSERIFIISGGFKEIIYEIVRDFHIKEENVFANEFIYNEKGVIINIDKNNPLSKNMGKVLIADKFKGYNIIVGDGYTDFEIKKFNKAKEFIQYTETVNRKNINCKADYIAGDFNKVISLIKKIHKDVN